MTKIIFSSLAAMIFTVSSVSAAPQGFDNASATAPQGFSAAAATNMTVANVIANGTDEMDVTMRGRITKMLGQDKFIFEDETGTIVVELDDDKDWSHIQKDQLIDIHGEVDRDANSIKVDVKDATALER
ncbi:YgiW/YdeI family stress tolerance OB fold protein [Anaerobiospirillum thomasii]|uniref:Uncharacterized conserved protein n=1 Tax=Anaerobiospirillum thomasii TaxID=179995 RepID=A0A2X0VCV2_9GAMM|nr:NirD/YgiW/YdeI family stress tolerance protein [Anaerobiospirillum thomasii]SPT70715.1 Uncharacterized conserved protein [Anaerobiospirillum thomasii]